MPVGLILGPVYFVDREVPDVINFGGKQMLAIHKNIGGSRVIDAMGPDPHEIKWAGKLLSFPNGGSSSAQLSADARARQLDALRQSGKQVQLTWPGFTYMVVIHDFECLYKNKWEIGYKIACVVINDSAATNRVATLDQAVQTDTQAVNLIANGGTP